VVTAGNANAALIARAGDRFSAALQLRGRS
jgi:hypothetical protein